MSCGGRRIVAAAMRRRRRTQNASPEIPMTTKSFIKTHTTTINITRSRRVRPVKVTHRIDYFGDGYVGEMVRTSPARLSLTTREMDLALNQSLVAILA
jgi:hypothetical protein